MNGGSISNAAMLTAVNNQELNNSNNNNNNNNANGSSGTTGQAQVLQQVMQSQHRDILVPVVLWCGSPTHWITAILITPDKRTIITGSQSGHLVISSVHLDKGKENQFLPRIFVIGHRAPVSCLSLCTLEGKDVVVSAASDGSVSVWNILDGFCLASSAPRLLGCAPSSMVSLPNGRQVAVVDSSPLLLSGSLDGTIRFWSLVDGQRDFSLQTICLSPLGEGNCQKNDAPIAIEFSPNGKALLVVSKSHWSIFTTSNSHKLWSIACPNPRGWFGVDQSDLKAFSLGHPVPLPGTSPLSLPPSSLSQSSFSSMDNLSMSSPAILNEPIDISFIAPDTEPPVLMLSLVNNEIGRAQTQMNPLAQSMASLANPNDITKKIGAAMCWSNVFLVGDSFGRVKIWVIPVEETNITKKTKEPNLIGHISDGWRGCETKTKSRVTASLVIEDLMLLIRGYEDGSISTSKLPTDLFTKFHPGAHMGKVNCLMSSQPGNIKRLLFSASNDTTIKVWDLVSFKLLHTFSHHTGPVSSIFSLPQTKRNIFVSISEDKTIGMYSMEDLSCKHMFGVHSSSISRVFWKSEQGYLLVETIDGSVSIWEFGSGELESVVYGQIAKDIIENADPLSNDWKVKESNILMSNEPFTTKSLVFTHKNDPPIQTIFLNIRAISDEIIKYTDVNVKYNTNFSSQNLNLSTSAIPTAPPTQHSTGLTQSAVHQPSANASAISLVQKELNQLVSIFSYLIPWGMDRTLEPMFKKDFQLRPPQPDFSFGLISEGGNMSFLTPQASGSAGKVQFSEFLTAQTTLSALALSRSIMRISGLENVCSQLATYYCVCLPDSLPGYVHPDFSYLASYCQDNSEEVMFSARSIFKISIERMSPQNFHNILSYYTSLLRSDSLAPIERARAVIVLAKIAAHRKEDIPENNPDAALPFLPRVIDYILKSLDPHMPQLRETCLKQTTAVLHLMVNKYPMVSFHHESQRLILGTLDGSLVIYDLKTASRWLRIDGHERAYISAVAFSENGKTLASYSSKDNIVKIWQSSSGFFGFLGSQFTCARQNKMPFDSQPLITPKVETIKLLWSGQNALTLVKDQNSFTLNIEA
eukprot:gene16083-19136_t